MFEPVSPSPDFPQLEEDILAFWRKQGIAQKALDKPAPAGDYVFYEGPPTANGKPGIHHVAARAMKDLFPRFHTMRGKRVRRRYGWDTHGLPVELEIEKRIGSTSKADIERFGVEEFNKLCRESVFTNINDWTTLTDRIGFWLEDNGYITYTNDYIESCWWILKSFYDRNLLFEDYKVAMHCPRCNTSLASHEVSLGMTEGIDDPSVWIIFDVDQAGPLADVPGEEPLGLVIWTTTPWTLAANTGIAVNPSAEYVVARAHNRRLVIAAALADATLGEGEWEELARFEGHQLAGITYRQVLRADRQDEIDTEGSWRVVADDFVSLDDGTGLVHLAPAYGDLELGRAHGLATLFSVGMDGKVLPGVLGAGDIQGMFFKDADEPIAAALAQSGALLKQARIQHTYPLCWRDDTPLLYFAKTSWYIRTTAVREQLLSNNQQINWVPNHIKDGRFGKWLENNVDWAISRERYWGTPLPIWQAEDGEVICVGSLAELRELTGKSEAELASAMGLPSAGDAQVDLHRPYIDRVQIERHGKVFTRIPNTIDVWFDSGAMPLAQWGYPNAGKEDFARSYPADFICEAIDQTRGWFYSLHAIATLLTDAGDEVREPGALHAQFGSTPAFKNCVVIGFVNDAEGKKMSKSRGNAVDPWDILNSRGADALRWYLYAATPPEANKNFDVKRLDESTRGFLMTLWNCYSFFTTYANIDKPTLEDSPLANRSTLDRWLVSRLQQTIAAVTEKLEAYDPYGAAHELTRFVVDDFSNWYLRLSRRRFWKTEDSDDKQAAFRTVFEALTTTAQLAAPLVPFVTETMFRNLRVGLGVNAPESVHLAEWPSFDASRVDDALVREMELAARAVELARSARAAAKIRTRVPVSAVLVRTENPLDRAAIEQQRELILAEINAKNLEFLAADTELVAYVVKPNFRALGPRLGKNVGAAKQALAQVDSAELVRTVRAGNAFTLDLAGQTLELTEADVVIEAKPVEGLSAQESDGLVVALRTELTPELLAEGSARDFVRAVQQARKDADLNISDRIELFVDAVESVSAALRTHQDLIAREVLANSISFDTIDGQNVQFTDTTELDDTSVTIGLNRIS
ncbi:MAG: isoleucine--tRNA ligase [Corynebacteriales bacterium]|nr:isoleucine--tRNA ligase [Mycobacteriales bacterium]